MGDGISDGIKEQEAAHKFRYVTMPWIKENLLGKDPLEMTPHENHLMYLYIREVTDIASSNVYRYFQKASKQYWDAYIGQGNYKHLEKDGKRIVVIK